MKVWIVMCIYDCCDAEWGFCGAFSTREKAIEHVKQDFQSIFEGEELDMKHNQNETFYDFYAQDCAEYEVFETNVN